MRKAIIAAIAAFVLVGCSSLGLAPAQSFNDRLAYSYGTHTGSTQMRNEVQPGR